MTSWRYFWRIQKVCALRAVTPFMMYLFMSLIALACQAISPDTTEWYEVLLGAACIACGAAFNAHLTFSYGKMHYDSYLTGCIHRKNKLFGIQSGGDHHPEQEYRWWKGLLIGFYVGVPVLVILNKADVIDVEKESVTEIVTEVRDTVAQHVPEGTQVDVIPLMAKGAEVWRRMIDRDNLTVFEVEFGQYIDWRLCEAMREAALMPEKIRVSVAEQMEEWRRLQKFSQAFRSSLEYLAKRVHPEAELVNKNVSKILDYADCRRAITASGIVALEEYIDMLTVRSVS